MNYRKMIFIHCFLITSCMIHASENKSKDASTQTVYESLIVNISKALDIPTTIQEDLEGDVHQKLDILFAQDTRTSDRFNKLSIRNTQKANEIQPADHTTGQAENDYQDRYPYDSSK